MMTKEELKGSEAKFLLIDCRELDEQGQIQGAQRIPLGRLLRDSALLPKDKEIVVYCRSGVRGQIAADFLEKKGFSVRNLKGGFSEWAA